MGHQDWFGWDKHFAVETDLKGEDDKARERLSRQIPSMLVWKEK